MVDVDRLMQIVKDSGMKICAICDKAGIERRVFYNRTTGGKSYLFNVGEIEGLAKVLNMDNETILEVFFAQNVYKNKLKERR